MKNMSMELINNKRIWEKKYIPSPKRMKEWTVMNQTLTRKQSSDSKTFQSKLIGKSFELYQQRSTLEEWECKNALGQFGIWNQQKSLDPHQHLKFAATPWWLKRNRKQNPGAPACMKKWLTNRHSYHLWTLATQRNQKPLKDSLLILSFLLLPLPLSLSVSLDIPLSPTLLLLYNS